MRGIISAFLILVLANTPAHSALVDNGSTVTDTGTGLMWQKCSIGQSWNGRECTGNFARVNWAQAKARCQASTVAGHSDWHLPTINQLRTLINRNHRPTIDPIFHTGASASDYWSSTSSDAQEIGTAWRVHFYDGNVGYYNQANTYFARAVRVANVPSRTGLRVLIEPAQARAAGARWRKAGTQAWRAHGHVEQLAPGPHVIEFRQIPGWSKPANRQVVVRQGQVSAVHSVYTVQSGLRVLIEPAQARAAGARWRKAGTQAWRAHEYVEQLAPGPHVIEFRQIPGWRKPANQRIVVQMNRMTTARGRYARVQGPLVIDHRHASLSGITGDRLTAAKNRVMFIYGYTSHGSQLITGAEHLRDHVAPPRYNFRAGWERIPAPTTPPSLRVGQDGSWSWDANAFLGKARRMINMNRARPGIKAFMWSWCGELSNPSGYTDAVVRQYLTLMQQLEREYPEVRFVYMTGHTDRWNAATLNRRNNLIRAFVRTHGKILYDFADIESHRPDGSRVDNPGDDCPWCPGWCATHPDDCRNLPTADDQCAHSHGLNCKIKGIALWHLAVGIVGR